MRPGFCPFRRPIPLPERSLRVAQVFPPCRNARRRRQVALLHRRHLTLRAPPPPSHCMWHYMHCLHTPERIKAMAQFRLGSHWLAVQQARLQGVPRQHRCCTHCVGTVEDELHLLECPLYADLRARFDVPTRDESMNDDRIKDCFTKQNEMDWNRLAKFLVECKRLRCRDNSSVPLGYHPADMPVGVTVAR